MAETIESEKRRMRPLLKKSKFKTFLWFQASMQSLTRSKAFIASVENV